MRSNFPGKNGRVTFLHLLSFNIIPSFGKILRAVIREKLSRTNWPTNYLITTLTSTVTLETNGLNVSNLKIWRFEYLNIWRFKDLKICIFKDLKIWKFDDLKIWWFEDLMIWRFEDLKIWRFEDFKISRLEGSKI